MSNNIFTKSAFRTKAGLALLALAFGLMFAAPAMASYPIPEEPSKQILVNKFVYNPANSKFVDNLGVDQHLFLPDQEVLFRVEVKNTGSIDLNNVKVSDKLPSQVSFVKGPGTVDANNVLSFTIDKLTPGETKTFDIKAKINAADKIAVNTTCPVNLVEAKVDNIMDQDTASFCIQKKILGVTKELPKTGVDTASGALLISSIGLGFATLVFKTKKLI